MVIGPGRSKKKCSAEGCTNELSMKECVGGSSGAAAKDSTIMLSKEECASGMGQVANYAAVKSVQTMTSMEERASDTGQRGKKRCSAGGCNNGVISGGVCLRHD